MVGNVKTAPFEKEAASSGNNPVGIFFAFWTFFYRFIGHGLEFLEFVMTMGTAVLIRWHFNNSWLRFLHYLKYVFTS